MPLSPPSDLVPFTPAIAVDFAMLAGFTVEGPETMELAIAYREDVKALIAEIEAGYKPHVAKAHALHKSLLAELNVRCEPARAALQALTHAIGRYELDRLQREQQARLAAEAAATEDTPPVAITVEPKVAGVSVSLSYAVEVTDEAALVRFAATQNPTLMALLVTPNLKGLQTLCTQMGDAFRIPGTARVAKAPVVRSTRV